MSRSVVEPVAQPRKLMTNSVISKMTANKETIARNIPVAKVLRRVLSTLSENIVIESRKGRALAYLSSNEGKSSSPSTTHVLTIEKKARTCNDCSYYYNIDLLS